MSLLAVQNFLARIFTDENLRREFANAPEEIGRKNNLTEKEIAELIGILPDEINCFADSLRRKRLREVEKLLPFTKKALDEEFEKQFREFAAQFTPDSIKKHLEDAVRFAEFLQTKEIAPVWVQDLAKFEQAKLEFRGYGKRFVFKIFNYNVKEICYRNEMTQTEYKKKKNFAVWLKIGKREFIF
ncbi:MAG: hypothetical protein LH614_00730 [Pyrinomonadaceae bacterium]|nr:hypothetical protein [Pyrinomonadaceae bacterium]